MAAGIRPSSARERRVENRDIVVMVLRGLVRRFVRDPGSLRHQLGKRLWIELKRFGALHVGTIEVSDLIGARALHIQGAVSSYCQLTLVALSRERAPVTIFEIGTYRGATTWLLAHNNPQARVFTLDLPNLEAAGTTRLELTDPEYFNRWERGQRFEGTPEAARITQLLGDSADFDFTPYHGRIDLVFVDGSHSYGYVRSDTEAALAMLSPRGTIVWDDYTYYPGIYAYLNELSARLDRPIEHIAGTRLAIYRAGQAPIRMGH